MPFQITALPNELFSEYFSLSDIELAKRNAKWIIADSKPGYPCRSSLEDAEIGERILAISFNHLDVSSPYAATGPIFIRNQVATAKLLSGEIPQSFMNRTYSIRGYSQSDMMITSEIGVGADLADILEGTFEDDSVAYIHIHHAGPGCYCVAAFRVGPRSKKNDI